MTNQEILDNAPEGATHVDWGVFLNANENQYWREKWIDVSELILEHETRSLTDIKRIAELEEIEIETLQFCLENITNPDLIYAKLIKAKMDNIKEIIK